MKVSRRSNELRDHQGWCGAAGGRGSLSPHCAPAPAPPVAAVGGGFGAAPVSESASKTQPKQQEGMTGAGNDNNHRNEPV